MKSLRVLIYSNPLVVDKIAKSFLYWKDSGFIFTKNLVRTFPKSWRIDWIVPNKLLDHWHPEWFKAAHNNVNLIGYPYSTSIHQNRYEFYGEILRKRFPYTTDVDVIINNQPEIAANLRVWAFNQRRDKPLIYSFFHWIDCKESRTFSPELGGYFWREYEGALHSDAVYLHPYGEDLFKWEIERYGLTWGDMKFRNFTPPPTAFGTTPIDLPDKKIILFNHRLNNTTQWKEVLAACETLYEERRDFVLWLTDENGALKEKNLKELPFVVLKHVDAESYGYLLSKSHFAVCNHRGYSTWNMAVADAAYAGCPVLLPDDSVYKGMFGKDGWYHSYTNLKERMSIGLDRHTKDLETIAIGEWVTLANRLIPLSSVSTDVEKDIEERLSGKLPHKYNRVKNLIFAEQPITKKVWVNKFWSFHTNSNFQKIRWQLLLDGIRDDTREVESTYYAA